MEFRLGVRVGEDISLDDLSRQFDAIHLATGAAVEKRIGIRGEDLTTPGLEVLREVNRGVRRFPWRRVAVVGGGNVGIDVARVLRRLGIEVVVYEKEERGMAIKEEIRKAEEEGVVIRCLTMPVAVEKGDGRLVVTCVRTKLGGAG